MPYINSRLPYENTLDYIENFKLIKDAGQLNYFITKVCDIFLRFLGGIRYKNINTVIGVLECCKLEFYRRIAHPYENYKMEEAGDVYLIPYIAGLFDGEGCISIYKPSQRKGYHLTVSVSNTDKNPLLKIQNLFQIGRIYERKIKGHKTVYNLQFTQIQSLEFLEKIYPFLRIKRDQAKIAIEFQKEKVKKGSGIRADWQRVYFKRFKKIKSNGDV